jgi:hypothetical protein
VEEELFKDRGLDVIFIDKIKNVSSYSNNNGGGV